MLRLILSARPARRAAALAAAVALGVGALAVVSGRRDAPRLDKRVAAPLDSAAASVTALLRSAASNPDSAVSIEAAVAAGYLERHRLGLAGPFRLADFALADPQLSPRIQRGVAWLIVRQAYFAQGYVLDDAVFRDISAHDSLSPAVREAHIELIERIVRDADDPRGGELSARIAYQLAAAERTVPQAVARLAIRLAAMARDRDLGSRDARALIDASREARSDPLELLPSWRASLRFEVERPVWNRTAWEERAVADALDWLRIIRAVSADTTLSDSGGAASQVRRPKPGLPPHVAAKLLAVSETRLAPQAAVVLATREYARRAVNSRMQAVNEEALAAELSLADNHADPMKAAVALEAAIGLRSLAQERVWFPGDVGPTERDVRRRFGYASIEFDAGVPQRWRPYLLRSLAAATADLQRALPPIAVAGSRIHFTARSPSDTLLAMHVAQTRTLVLPMATGAGTLAHELAHDLDARAGRAMYERGGYATDLAVRRQDTRMAASVAGLTHARLVAPGDGRTSPHRQRPAEVFARAVEWLVPAALARDGRTNGFLSSVQDELLTGGGSVVPADVSLGSIAALSDLLDEMPSPDARAAANGIRARFAGISEWTPARVIRLVMETPMPTMLQAGDQDRWAFLDPVGSLQTSLAAQAQPCVEEDAGRTPQWRDDLLRAAVDARLRGSARSRARRSAMSTGSVARFLGLDGPWNDSTAETFVERAREAMLGRIYDRVGSHPSLPDVLNGASSPPVCARG